MFKKIFLYFLDIFLYYGSGLFSFFGFILIFAFLIGGRMKDDDFLAFTIEKKWWLVAALSLLVAGYVMRRRSKVGREEQVRYRVRRMFRKARKNAGKK